MITKGVWQLQLIPQKIFSVLIQYSLSVLQKLAVWHHNHQILVLLLLQDEFHYPAIYWSIWILHFPLNWLPADGLPTMWLVFPQKRTMILITKFCYYLVELFYDRKLYLLFFGNLWWIKEDHSLATGCLVVNTADRVLFVWQQAGLSAARDRVLDKPWSFGPQWEFDTEFARLSWQSDKTSHSWSPAQ